MKNNRSDTRYGMHWFSLMLLALMFLFTAVSLAHAGKNNLIFILDASGSMWGQVEGTAKISIAKEVLTGLVQDLSQDTDVGLVAYGHRRKGDCRDVEELVPLSDLDKGALITKIRKINPKGKTPITYSIQVTAENIKALEDETKIILVSDGKETCEGDPCALVKELRQSGVRFVMHVIGFDVTEEERSQLECIAQAGGGMYYSAKNAGEFQMAAQKVVKETQTTGFLEITALRNGRPVVAHIEVLTPDKVTRVTTANSSAERDKPVSTKLKPGAYTVKVTDTGLIEKPSVTFLNVEIKAGKTVKKIAEFSAGYMSILATKDGKPFETMVHVYHQGERNSLAYEKAYREKAALFGLLPGHYDIKLTDDSVPEKPEVTIKGLEIKAGETLEKIVEFAREGILDVSPVKEGKLFQAWVYIHLPGKKKELTYKHATEKRPASFKLLPGIYDIKVRDDSVPEKPEVRVKGLEIKAGETLEKIVEFAREGILDVSPVKEGKLFNSWVYIYRPGEKKELTYKHATEKRPASFKLLPGIYDIKVRDDSVPEKPEVRVNGLEVKSGETMEKVVEFTLEGVLDVSPVKEGKLFTSWVYIHRPGEEKELTYKHATEKRPASFKLLPGVYDIKVKDNTTKSIKELKGVTVESGKLQRTEVIF